MVGHVTLVSSKSHQSHAADRVREAFVSEFERCLNYLQVPLSTYTFLFFCPNVNIYLLRIKLMYFFLSSLLKTSRANLLKHHSDPSTSLDQADAEFTTYVSLLLGFLNDYSGRTTGDGKLRYSIKSKWSQSLNPNVSQSASISINTPFIFESYF